MGTNCAVVYANIVGWYIEIYPAKLCNSTGLLQYYKRFVDDSFAVLQGTRQEVLKFIELLNSRSKTINFTFELSQTAVDFMDLTIFLDERRPREILTKIFWKKISTFQYCSYKSFHRQQSKRAWIKAELQRFRTKTSLWEDFLFTRDFFFDRLRARATQENSWNPSSNWCPSKPQTLTL
jgi:hypothetical protein